MKIQCPHCQNETDQVKAGKNQTGSQRSKCNPCKRRYTPEPKQQGSPDEIRQKAVRLYGDGQNFRRIARQLNVDHKLVIHWGNAHAAQRNQAPAPDDVNDAGMDELFTCSGAKQESIRDDLGGLEDELHSGTGCRD